MGLLSNDLQFLVDNVFESSLTVYNGNGSLNNNYPSINNYNTKHFIWMDIGIIHMMDHLTQQEFGDKYRIFVSFNKIIYIQKHNITRPY